MPRRHRHAQTNPGHPLGYVASAGTVMFGLDPDIQVKPYSLINPWIPGSILRFAQARG